MTTQVYYLPKSLSEATSILADSAPDLLVIAGGTLAMPLINEGISMPERVLGLKKAGLNYMERSNGQLKIGAMRTLSQMALQTEVPILAVAAEAVGGWAIRNMGTVGGNLFAPPPSGDYATALLALDAHLKLVRKGGERVLPLERFYKGFMANDLAPEELLAEIQINVPRGKTAYLKYGRRHANTPSIVAVAAVLEFNGQEVKAARLALNGAGSHPVRAKSAEEFLVGKILTTATMSEAGEIAGIDSEPFTDAVASEWYRRKMIPVIVRRTLEQIAH